MESKNVIAAIALSSAVIVLYALFFTPEQSITKPNLSEKNKIIQIASKLDMSTYSEKALYNAKIDLISSKISSNKLLRKALINYQRRFPKIQKKKICLEHKRLGRAA